MLLSFLDLPLSPHPPPLAAFLEAGVRESLQACWGFPRTACLVLLTRYRLSLLLSFPPLLPSPLQEVARRELLIAAHLAERTRSAASFNARVPLVAALTESDRRQLALSIDIKHSTAELNRMKHVSGVRAKAEASGAARVAGKWGGRALGLSATFEEYMLSDSTGGHPRRTSRSRSPSDVGMCSVTLRGPSPKDLAQSPPEGSWGQSLLSIPLFFGSIGPRGAPPLGRIP